jgi:dolichyl-phosphate-mannose--protein O-mannosyl transferase
MIPFLIYLASYIPQFRFHDWDIFWGMQRQMWWYHTGLVATHPFTSPWWSWPVMSRPLWLYTSGVSDGVVGNIYAMGNPVIFWAGLAALLYLIYKTFVEKDKKLLFICAAYCAVFVPWAFSPRIMFLYHYFPAVPFLVLGLGYQLSKLRNSKIILFMSLTLLVFVYFYPHLTGIKVPVELSNSYYWLPGWR